MVGKRLISLLRRTPTSQLSKSAREERKTKSWGQKAVSGALICLTGGVALSALDDLIIFGGCSREALEKASKNQAIVDAIGEPIVRGPWYNASLAVAHRRNSVSCTFPISGPQGTGILQLKAVRNGDDNNWFSFFRSHNWEILIMDALVHVPSDEEKLRTLRISVMDTVSPPPDCKACAVIKPTESAVPREAKS